MVSQSSGGSAAVVLASSLLESSPLTVVPLLLDVTLPLPLASALALPLPLPLSLPLLPLSGSHAPLLLCRPSSSPHAHAQAIAIAIRFPTIAEEDSARYPSRHAKKCDHTSTTDVAVSSNTPSAWRLRKRTPWVTQRSQICANPCATIGTAGK